MKQMSLIEMDGFLKGKCIPCDLKVNETNAEYLVRKFAEAEAKCAALAAENAALKQSEKEFNNFCRQEYYGWEDNFTETPATDAFLAEVRAQGVEMYADNLDNGADDAERGGFDYAVKFLRSEASGVRLFADQLRKGGNQ
ncbi:hypothetical protein LGL83_09520 [Escherichia coli]|uniref:hypothetical protein n=2 Tax=Escherichia coli TaxID=562 RepID=UPI00092C69D5|nr:hypothetical protein [Escherichia coli]EFE6013049.1 hypothetical protein [Escherichia coli]EFN9482351.1 hypothetical protein [Escherichia coli]EJH0822652.1 hypothetical protein [Escherichia coli]MBW4296764.1 hypothetical protein [Escherichia coli]MCA7107637.1 hypothetical protein [Escherichia coli]